MLQQPEAVHEFERCARLPDGRLDLARASLVLASVFEPALNIETHLVDLDRLGRELHARIPDRPPDPHGLSELIRFLAQEMRFRGNSRDYEDPRNSFLDQVLERRLGIPITLSVLYMTVAARAGLHLDGVGYPGHFLLRWIGADGTALYVDPFNGGQMLARDDLLAGLVNAGLEHPRAETFLAAVTKRQILSRMLNNIKAAFARRGNLRETLSAVELLLTLNPWDLDERRDRGLLSLELGHPAPAVADLEAYLHHCPEAPDASRVAHRLEQARGQAADEL